MRRTNGWRGRTRRLSTAQQRLRARGCRGMGVAATTGRTSAGGRRPVAPAADTLGRQAGRPVVAGDSCEEIRVGGPQVFVGGRTAAGHLGGPLVFAAGSTSGEGGGVEGPLVDEVGCAKGGRVAGPLVDEVGSTHGGIRLRL